MTETPEFATRFVNLASPKMGTEAVACSDDFFAPMARMLQDHDPVWIPEKYDDRGKWMDGWESRRKRTPGHDWCLIRLGVPGVVRGVDIDTAHFTGNYPPEAMLEGCRSETGPGDGAEWTTLVPRCALGSSCNNFAASTNEMPVNWLRLNIYPDGGVARLRVFGEPVVDWDAVAAVRID
ncbi:MAG: allantoicase, partial [Rhodospirillaceae bacterium]|nr:allantoicase [Rhodospirillaceae bacterium]